MKKKATLLLQHLERIYTMVPPYFSCIHHGFIAFHHDFILAVGEGEGWTYVDKDTRIVEGRNHIAMPGFIDVSIHLEMPKQATLTTTIRNMREQGEIRMKNATLIGNLIEPLRDKKDVDTVLASYEFTYIQQPYTSNYPIVYPLENTKSKLYKRFCISSGSTHCLDQLLCAKLYYRTTQMEAIQILGACTIYPAHALHLSNVGSIAKGKLGNVLVVEGQCIEDVLSKFHGNHHIQVIKEGIRILPNIII